MNILKLVLMGVVAVVLTVALPFVVGIFVPGTAFITGGKNDVPNMPPGYSYSREELDKFEREMKERVSRPNKSAVDVSSREVSTYVRKSFWWCSWIPWVLLPFLVQIKARSIGFGLLAGLV